MKTLIAVALLFTTSVLAQDVPLQRVKPQKTVAAAPVTPEVQASIDQLKVQVAELNASIVELKAGLAAVKEQLQAQAKVPATVVPPPELPVGHSFFTAGLIGVASEHKKWEKWCGVHPDGLIRFADGKAKACTELKK